VQPAGQAGTLLAPAAQPRCPFPLLPYASVKQAAASAAPRSSRASKKPYVITISCHGGGGALLRAHSVSRRGAARRQVDACVAQWAAWHAAPH
jgi:hypothetical protein